MQCFYTKFSYESIKKKKKSKLISPIHHPKYSSSNFSKQQVHRLKQNIVVKETHRDTYIFGILNPKLQHG